jgi:hypothetical protein
VRIGIHTAPVNVRGPRLEGRGVHEAARIAGGKVIVVDAIDESAARFYEHHDFEATPVNPGRLAKKLSSIAAALDLPWP